MITHRIPKRSQQHLNHRSLYRKRSPSYLRRKLIINIFRPSPLFLKLQNEEFSGGTYMQGTLIYSGE